MNNCSFTCSLIHSLTHSLTNSTPLHSFGGHVGFCLLFSLRGMLLSLGSSCILFLPVLHGRWVAECLFYNPCPLSRNHVPPSLHPLDGVEWSGERERVRERERERLNKYQNSQIKNAQTTGSKQVFGIINGFIWLLWANRHDVARRASFRGSACGAWGPLK